MYKTIKIFLILFLIIALSFNFVYATSPSETNSTNEISEQENSDVVNDTTDTPMSTLSPSSVTSVSNVNSYEQANLQLNNILSIILIAIGVLLILFAIAILIRLK